jgi:hypothetical protein
VGRSVNSVTHSRILLVSNGSAEKKFMRLDTFLKAVKVTTNRLRTKFPKTPGFQLQSPNTEKCNLTWSKLFSRSILEQHSYDNGEIELTSFSDYFAMNSKLSRLTVDPLSTARYFLPSSLKVYTRLS